MHTSSHALARLLGDWAGPGPAHRRLSDLVRLLILDGRLPLDTALPGERDLAAVLGISRTTVSTAYTTLREQGYLTARDRARGRTRVPPGDRQPEPGTAGPDLLDFSHAASPAPGEALHRAYTRALDQLPRYLPRHGYAHVGLGELRAAVAQRYTDRGLPTAPEQILVTNGAQHAFSLLVRTILRPRDRVVTDHPSYPHALRVLRNAGCRITPVAVTDDGWDVDTLVTAARGAALAFLIPDFHNPTGLLLSEVDRPRLRLDCPLVVDETMAELALDADPPVPVAAYHPGVISIGSAAKTFWGGLRVGWLRADRELVQRLGQARSGTDLGTPVVEQLACAELLREIGELLPDRLAGMRERRSLLLDLVRTRLPDWTVGRSSGGLSVWARLPDPVSSALAAVAPQFGVHLAAGPRFGIGGAFERYLRLPYSLDADPMRAGIEGIASALAAVRSGHRADPSPTPLA
ncbi:MocR-like transcription factor YczR [Amycolatopsis magusensis]|uniref:DNA-binding transcriptional MocR family regulator n=1 Tax=Amycolatopsis magusensis TaxID=882444 RepID=A0ABS4Q6G5_9PSEU|nr:PLP-dependent aminotransferase family protein [Amycolatopsis magusensis]MBP2186668.1 DNA-binding transcriptional MocR family regulator [Amycolatopsis magusensis]